VYKTEPELGIAIKEGGVPREKLYVVTKCNRDMNDIEGSLKASLKKLQLDYVNLLVFSASLLLIKGDADHVLAT
jgi:diketogulonate reductase-like aldo/keto reductase